MASGEVESVVRGDGGFVVKLAGGRMVRARRLLVATGLVDELPDIPGIRARWGRDVLHCPYCHGWEVRDQAVGVLATGPMSVHQALLFTQWTDDVVFFRRGTSLTEEQAEQLAARGIQVVEGEVASLEIADDRLVGVRLAHGAVVAREAVAVSPRMVARASFLAGLGIQPTPHPMGEYIEADRTGRTDVPGVWVAGNVTDLAPRRTQPPERTGDVDLVSESRPADAGKTDGPLVKVILVVLLGSVMTTIDMTIINVALQPLTLQFQSSLDTIQWIATGYLLALGMVVPVTGWASDRFGTKRLFMLAIAFFVVGSALAGAAWNVETLIAFRVLQGFGGGMLAPAAMTILTNAAGPHRIGRAMAALGVPMLLGPIAGPILGGWLVDAVNWRWIFYVNVPVGVIAILVAWRLLPTDEPRPAEKFDLPGVLMLSPSLAALIYGISNIPHHGGVAATAVWLPALVGILLLAGFILHALKTENPLIDLTLFRNRTFTAATVTMTLYMIAFLGAMMVVPTYFMLVRGHGALAAGLLVAPQGIGALLTMPIAGRLADRIGAGKVVLPGLVLISGSFAMLTQVGADSPYWLLMLALFVAGLGMGLSMMPINSAALQTLTKRMVARASAALTVVQQTAGAIGAALVSIILAGLLAGQFGVSTSDGQLAATAALADPATHDAAAAASASAFASTFAWTLVLVALCLIPAAFLPKRGVQSSTVDEVADEDVLPPAVTH